MDADLNRRYKKKLKKPKSQRDHKISSKVSESTEGPKVELSIIEGSKTDVSESKEAKK